MITLYIFTAISLLISFIINTKKTLKALKMAGKKLKKILPPFLAMIVLISISLFFVSDQLIATYLGKSNFYLSALTASFFGSITIMPGFIAFPLGGLLISKGVSYTVIATFTTTLMLVGIMTYPVEKKFFGTKITIIRNIICYFVAIIVSLVVGLIYGEIL